MLHNSSLSDETPHKDIVTSTSAVVFLGTPHRGSEDMAGLGEAVRKIAATILRMDTNSAALDALGLKSTDLQRCQESFSRLWSTYDFRVKTFQEGLGLTGINIGPLKEKVLFCIPCGKIHDIVGCKVTKLPFPVESRVFMDGC
jgi:protein SERAC1